MRVVAIVLALLAAGGCRGFDRAGECARVAELTNEALALIAELDSKDDKAPPADNYAKMSAHYQDLERQLTELEQTPLEGELAAAVASLRAALRVASRETQRYGDMLRELKEVEADDFKAHRTKKNLERARERMTKNQRSYQAAYQRIERHCSVR